MNKLKIVGKTELPPKPPEPPEPIWHAVCQNCGTVSEAPASAWDYQIAIYSAFISGTCPSCGKCLTPIQEPAPDCLRTKS